MRERATRLRGGRVFLRFAKSRVFLLHARVVVRFGGKGERVHISCGWREKEGSPWALRCAGGGAELVRPRRFSRCLMRLHPLADRFGRWSHLWHRLEQVENHVLHHCADSTVDVAGRTTLTQVVPQRTRLGKHSATGELHESQAQTEDITGRGGATTFATAAAVEQLGSLHNDSMKRRCAREQDSTQALCTACCCRCALSAC